MQKVLSVAIIRFVSVISFMVLANSFMLGQSVQKNENVPDNIFYTYLFHRMENLQTEDSLVENIKNGANLTDKQYQILKNVIADYSKAFSSAPKKEKLQLASSYRNKLKIFFGVNKFAAFDSFAKAEFSDEIVYSSNAPSAFLGSVSISITESTHTLQGQAGIIFNDDFDTNLIAPCSVNAVMSGPNVSQSGSMSSDCDVQTPSVTLTDTGYVGGSQYCITGNFTGVSGPTTKTMCLNSPGVPHISSVTYERPNNGDLPIDFNPNAGDGFRIFPDKNLPTEQIDRRKILI